MSRLYFLAIALLLGVPVCAGTAFLKYETEAVGTSKQCVYDDGGSEVVITVRATALCPLTIRTAS